MELLGAGTDSAAFRVDGEWVVRFPLVADAQRTLATELALLPQLALPVPTPRPEYVGEQDGQLRFVAYRALEGEPLSDATLGARALDELAAVLDAIHRFPLETARAAGVSFELHKGGPHAGHDNLELRLAGMLEPGELATIAEQRRAFEAARPQPSEPVLLHADIKPEHLLHDPATGSLTGLLDWGDASLGHPDFDLAIIGGFCGPRTLAGLLERMNPADAGRARAGIPFLLTLRWVQDALFDIDRGDAPDLRLLRKQLER